MLMALSIMQDASRDRMAQNSTVMQRIMPLDQSSGFLARMLMDAAATLPWAIPESRPPKAMGRQETKTVRP